MSLNQNNSIVNAGGDVVNSVNVSHSDVVYTAGVTNINIYKVQPQDKKKKEKVTNNIEIEECVPENIFIDSIKSQSRPLSIIPRRRWLAQKAIDFENFKSLPQFVIICHTASESSSIMMENISLIRDIQSLHIESRKWSDIGYNFLIGEDGNVYEGRGWDRIGAHTFGLNKYSLGIAFVGCYMAEKPPSCAIVTLSALLDFAVKEKHINPDYKLVGHCQFLPYNSPGKFLYDIIKQHPHYEPNPVRPS